MAADGIVQGGRVSAQVSAGETQRSGELRLRTALDAMIEAYVLLEAVRDESGTIQDFVFVDANTAACVFHARSHDELIGAPLLGPHAAPGSTELFCLLVRVVETGQPLVLEDWVYPQDLPGGRPRHCDVRTMRMGDGVQQVWRDVTERHQAHDELRAQSAQIQASKEELEAFIYTVSHDLRQPLSAINAFSQLVMEDAEGQLSPDAHTHLARVRAATQRMAGMLDGLLELSRASRVGLVSEPVDVSAMACDIVAELRAEQPARLVRCAVAPGLVAVCTPSLVHRVLLNLLSNAFKFTSEKGTACIEVGETEADGARAFFVRDDGVGFEPSEAGRIFQPFQRLHDAGRFPGTGIGLATVKRLVARCGGRVWAEAEAGTGATFYFTIPESAESD
jgi:signal transduction histidine kinase